MTIVNPLPREWCDDEERRTECHVPTDRTYQKHWELALEVLSNISKIPHACILADSELGRFAGKPFWPFGRWTIEDCLERAKTECGMGQVGITT